MGKSLRSKTKRTFRAKKREDSVYAAVHAARLNRLNSKLKAITQTDKDGDFEVEVEGDGDGDAGAEMQGDQPAAEGAAPEDAMELDGSAEPSKRISTHGPRTSRREAWRVSKGLPAKEKSRGMNKQGMPMARRKAGRSQRRR